MVFCHHRSDVSTLTCGGILRKMLINKAANTQHHGEGLGIRNLAESPMVRVVSRFPPSDNVVVFRL